MDDFGLIESGFSNADETINFGTRSIGHDTLYEISTLACLKCSEDNSGIEELFLNSLVKCSKFYLAVNKSLKVFEDTELSVLFFNAIFDSIIDNVCVSPDGKILLLCLRSGMVHIFDLEKTAEENCIFSKSFMKNEWSNNSYVGCYVERVTRKTCNFIIISTKGKIFRVCLSLNISSDENVTNVNNSVNWEEIHDFGSTINMACFSYPILAVQTSEMNIFNVETKNMSSDSVACNLKMICSFGHKLLALDENGHLFRICSLSLLIFQIENIETLFEEIVVLNDNNGNKLIASITKKNELGESYLQLLNSDFSIIFSLKLKNPVHLVQLDNVSDETLILSKIVNSAGLFTELRLQCVYETQPELRLSRLLKKQRFDEAEKFAKTFNIDPKIVLRARAQVIVDKTVCTSEDVTKLIQLLESIDDDYFKIQCCSNVECSNYEDVRKILNYGSMIVPKSHCENKEATVLLQRLLMDMLFKFDTYMAVYCHYDLQTWTKFSSCDLIDELKMFLKNFQIEEAIIIYSRLDIVTLDTLTEERIEEILSILNNLPVNIYQPFLLTFIPVTMACKASALTIFVRWLKLRIFHLEKRDAYNFPDNGINFAEYILKLLKVEESGYIFFQRQCTLNKEVLDELALLMESLRGVQLLKNNFRINISLSEYLMGPKTVTRTLLNIVMPPEDYDVFLKEFLYNFMIQNQFEPDEIFLDEIKNLIKYDEEYWVKIVEAILKYISSTKIKLEAVKEILENARVPWCDTVRTIGQSALQHTHPLVSDIRNILENEPKLLVLRNPKYKIKEKQITTIGELEYIAKRIVYINEPSMVADVNQLCQTQREKRVANIILIQHFIRNRDYEKAMSILDNIGSKEDIYFCAKWIASFAEIAINNEVRSDKLKHMYYQILGPLFRRLKDNNSNKIENDVLDEDFRILRGVYNLNKSFRRNFTSHDLRSSSYKNKIFNELIEEVCEDFNKGSSNIECIFKICDKLSTFLSLDKDTVLIKFCEKIAKYEEIFQIADHLYKNETNPKNLCLVAVLLFKYMGSCSTHLSCDSFNENSYELLHSDSDLLSNSVNSSNTFINGLNLSEKIVVKALVSANEEELLEVIEVMNWVNSCLYLTRSEENPLLMELFSHIYHSENTLPGYSTFATVSNVFNVFCRYIANRVDPTTTYKYLTSFEGDEAPLTEEQLLQEINLLPETVDSLCREGQHLTAYKLLLTLENGLRQTRNIDQSTLKLLATIINKKCLPQLLHVVVSAKHIDKVLFENLLLASHKDYHKYIEHYLKLYKRQPRKLHDIATVGIKLLNFHREQLLQEINLLPETVDSLCREGQHLTAYKLLLTLENGLRQTRNIDQSTLKLLATIINKKCLPQLLHVVVSAKHIDKVLFENLLLASHKDYHKYIEHYLKLYKRQPRKLHDIATVGIKLLNFHRVTAGKDVLLTAVITCKWWNRLKSCISDIPYDVFFKANAGARLKLLLKLEAVDVHVIQEYCEDYNLELQIYYMEYLKSILVNWKPDYEYKANPNGGRGTLIMKNNELGLHLKCLEVIKVIKDKDAVYSLLDKIWDTANFYHYEVFICILKLLNNTGKSERTRNLDMPLLLFLKNYHRFSAPSHSEKEQWYGTFPDNQILDPLSEYRLPYTQILFTYDIWNIIRPEINLKSYRYWFDAINILRKNLKKDDICIYAVKEVTTSGVLGKEESTGWSLYPKFENLFAEVDLCVQNISNLERATSVVYHLMNHTPNGADKVNAAQLSYKYARKYKEMNPNSPDVDKAYIKVRTKYYSFSASHILHTFDLADDKYLQLVTQPEDLIDALYRDERILKQAESINFGCPDINTAVDRLGELYDLKVGQIRYNLLVHLLNDSSSDLDFDSTLVITHTTKLKANSDDNLKRATYICRSGDKSFWQTYLLKVGLNEEDVEESEQKSLSFKAKALKCFCAISDVDTIVQLTEVDYQEFLNYIDKLSLLSDLECLGIALNVEMLDQYNKKELLKRLSKVGKPSAIKVMASLCVTYLIKDIQYWEFIINNAIKFGLFVELKTYVDFLKNQCYKRFYINAWQVIIDNAFHIPVTLSKEELREVYIKNFLMIQSCPVLFSLNLEGILQKCIKSGKLEFAAVLLQYLPDDKKDTYVKMISPSRTLLLDLDNLSKSGIWGIRKIKSWMATKDLF